MSMFIIAKVSSETYRQKCC